MGCGPLNLCGQLKKELGGGNFEEVQELVRCAIQQWYNGSCNFHEINCKKLVLYSYLTIEYLTQIGELEDWIINEDPCLRFNRKLAKWIDNWKKEKTKALAINLVQSQGNNDSFWELLALSKGEFEDDPWNPLPSLEDLLPHPDEQECSKNGEFSPICEKYLEKKNDCQHLYNSLKEILDIVCLKHGIHENRR